MPSYYDDGDHVSHEDMQAIHGLSDKKTDLLSRLTKREEQTLSYLAQGLSNKDIAEKMCVKSTTIKIYVANLCKKLDVENRTQVAILSHQFSLSDHSQKTTP